MRRAAILIGVDKAGEMPKLNDAANGANMMAMWARGQGMDPVHLITDERRPVRIREVWQLVTDLVNSCNISQLLVYFAGHGVNIQRQEYWLLSDAPDNTSEAVNLAASTALAATCGIPHIVFISDTCRTAPEGLRLQSITGSEIFPNREGDTNPVDQFYSCQLGKPSHEVKDPNVSSAEFRAIYTQELYPALLGQRPQIIEWISGGQEKIGRIHMRSLRDFMCIAIQNRLERMSMKSKITQKPVAQINSDPPAWLSEVNDAFKEELYSYYDLEQKISQFDSQITNQSITTELMCEALLEDEKILEKKGEFYQEIIKLERPFWSSKQKSICGFKLRGLRAIDVVANGLNVKIKDIEIPYGSELQVNDWPSFGSNVLLVLEHGGGVLLPAIPGFMCELSFDDTELINVAYEPLEHTNRWNSYQTRVKNIRRLRAVASTAAVQGKFKFDKNNALDLDQLMQFKKEIDPSIALYAAYAYHDMQCLDIIREIAGYMRRDLGALFFDIALLARYIDKHSLTPDENLIAPFPLMAQGWALLHACEVQLSSNLQVLMDKRLPSLWTMFDAQGVDHIRIAINKGEIK